MYSDDSFDGIDAYQGLALAIEELHERQSERVKVAHDAAMARRSYKVARRQRILAERRKGTPTTYLKEVVEGYCDISMLAYNMEMAEELREANHEGELAAKKMIDTYREILAREWAEAKQR